MKPKHQPLNNRPFSGQTISATDYQKWHLQPKFAIHKPQYQPNGSPLDKDTTYKVAYKGNKAPKAKAVGPVYSQLKNGVFEGTTTYHDDFIGFGKVDRSKDFKPRADFDKTRDERFDLPEPLVT